MTGEKETQHPLPEQQFTVNNEADELEEFLTVMEDSYSSSSSLSSIASSTEEDLIADMFKRSQDLSSEDSSSLALTITSEDNAVEDSSSEEDEDNFSALQSTQDTQHFPLTPVDVNISNLVIFLLSNYQLKELVTKEEMLSVIKGYEDNFSEFLLRASERIEIVFGLDVKEVDPINHCYALHIKLDLTYDGLLSETEGIPKTGLLILILSVILMSGNGVKEEQLWQELNRIGVYSGMKHILFGEPKNLIAKEFVEENYLEYRVLPNHSTSCYEFVWGPRAHTEVSKIKLIEYLAKVRGADPSSFPWQHSEDLNEEVERVQARASATPSTSATTDSSCASPGALLTPTEVQAFESQYDAIIISLPFGHKHETS